MKFVHVVLSVSMEQIELHPSLQSILIVLMWDSNCNNESEQNSLFLLLFNDTVSAAHIT
jgi:hypothetical protein